MSPHATMTNKAQRQILAGTFVQSKSRAELDYWYDTVVCVDEAGVIVKIQRDCGDVAQTAEELRERLGWASEEVATHICKEGQFYFPGFIGESELAP